MKDDIDRFIEVEQRVKSQKAGTAAPKRVVNTEDNNEDDLDGLKVDINKNFNMLTSFGSEPIVICMERYVFEVLFPALQHYLELKIPIKDDKKPFFFSLFAMIQMIVSFASKDIHFEKAKSLFKSIKQFPQYKEYGGETLSNKLLTQWI